MQYREKWKRFEEIVDTWFLANEALSSRIQRTLTPYVKFQTYLFQILEY